MNTKAETLVQSIRYATISSVDSNGKPWAAPVWYVFDTNNIYWWSPVESQHSKNISINSNVYITIFDSRVPEGEGFGLYLEAEARQVSEDELETTMALYNASTKLFKLDQQNCSGNAPTRMYKATITKCWINDGVEQDGFYVDRRVEL